jgi:hypothetical protein
VEDIKSLSGLVYVLLEKYPVALTEKYPVLRTKIQLYF